MVPAEVYHLQPVSIARRRLVVLRRRLPGFGPPDFHRFNRPKAISGLATSWSTAMGGDRAVRFNRPKAISGLATTMSMVRIGGWLLVSIARRRLVVLRPPTAVPSCRGYVGFNRPKAISGLATIAIAGLLAGLLIGFQSPEGD